MSASSSSSSSSSSTSPSDSSWRVFWRLLACFAPYRHRIVPGLLLAAVATLAGIGLMGVSGWFLTSMGLAGVAGVSMNYFVPAAAIRGAAIVRTVGRYAERLLNHDITLRVLSHLRVHVFTRLLPLAPARTGFLGQSELFSRLRADVDRLEHAYLAVLMPLLVATIAVPAVAAVLAFYVWQVALLSVVVAVLVGVMWPYVLARQSAVASVRMVALEAQLRATTTDALQGAAELRLYGAADAQRARIAALTCEHGTHRRRLDALQARGGAVVTLAAQWTTIAALLLGARALQQQTLAPAQLTMIVLLALAQFDALASLPEAISQLRATLVSAARVFALIDAEPAVVEWSSAALPAACADIRFRNVSMRYRDAHGNEGPWALQDVTLDLPAGHRLAVVGPSGAGKSSLVNALLRFYPIQSGTIEWQGRDIATLSGDAMRNQIAVVEQRTTIFNGTLLDNLLLARPDADAAQIERALSTAQLTAFVAGLPEGLRTWVGEGGVLLSGGEARRLAIARALLADRPILLLDEPTEGVDATTAQSLLTALGQLMEGRTVLLITHRLAGLASLVDEKVTLCEGRIVSLPLGAGLVRA